MLKFFTNFAKHHLLTNIAMRQRETSGEITNISHPRCHCVIGMIFATFLYMNAIGTGIISDSINIAVYDSDTRHPVEFCNIVAKNVPTGALADEAGRARLRVGPRTLRDTLLVSSIGYEKLMVAMKPEVADMDTFRIFLTPKEYKLPEVTAKPPRKTKVLKKGKRHSSGIIKTAVRFSRGECLAWEAGAKDKRTWLTGVEMQSFPAPAGSKVADKDSAKVAENRKPLLPLQKMRMRVNIYDASQKRTKSSGIERWDYTNILHTPILFTYNWDDVADNRFIFTLPDPVLLPEKALVEIEMLDEMPDNELVFFKSNLFGRGVMSRDVNDKSWVKLPVAVPFTLLFLEEK